MVHPSTNGRVKKIIKRSSVYAAIGLVLLGSLLSTPLLLRAVAPERTDWSELSDISQTYGSVSVGVSALALAGVVASLIYQARQTRVAQEEAARAAHRELVLFSLGDPALFACWEPSRNPVTVEEWKRLAFTNLIFQRWANSFALGRTTEQQARGMLLEHFRGQPARGHWERARTGWIRHAEAGTNRRARHFAHIAEECYQAAVAAGPAVEVNQYFEPDGTATAD
ncbi:DUF6082 family protein [Streptomyces sp. AS02]|uniref:DUF6082 family protein n=1 Tax=Streptomyces sp. AS02 TaxID=2938946 RepID=UPI0020222CC9|nr:DUF6082 family protein [Streptomyces sp. AS02]MCL8014497.1 DUF6082 family protein [Streptomyces sp. AS02]